jgi:hypothetical protein
MLSCISDKYVDQQNLTQNVDYVYIHVQCLWEHALISCVLTANIIEHSSVY